MKRRACKRAATIAVLLAVAGAGAATVTVDKETKYQTIEGLGAGIHTFNTFKVQQGPFLVDADLDSLGFYDTVVCDLGLSLMRLLEDGDFEIDSGVYTTTEYMARQLMHARKFLEAAARQEETLRVITSVLSPPAYMKVNGVTACGSAGAPTYSSTDCRMKDEYDDEYARFVVEYLERTRDSLGVEQYAFSIQNEPAFREPYASCVYGGPRYAQTLKVVGATVRDAGLTTRFFGAEHMSWAFPSSFEFSVRRDAEALAYMHAWAVHGYTDGVQADTGSFGGTSPTDKGLWMSETGGKVHTWTDAMTQARLMLSYLRDGHVSGWNWHSLMINGTDTAHAMYANGRRTLKFYVVHHFFRYIRPGARQIASSTDNSDLEVVAFWHEANQCMTIVLRNPGTAKTLTGINGSDLPGQFSVITSTEGEQLTTSTTTPSSSLTLPAASVTTLVAGRYMGGGTGTVTRTPRKQTGAGAVHANAARQMPHLFRIDGKRMVGVPHARHAGGIYFQTTPDGVRLKPHLR